MNRQELIDYISRKQEAIEFWRYLKSVPYQQEKINRLMADMILAKFQMYRLEGKRLDIRLNWMAVRNFMGLKDFDLHVNGKNITIKGDNATYKTTCYDAFCWVVTGKDSFNRADFDIKPRDEDGEEIHFLETEVELELSVDGETLNLKKILTENWVKPKGETKQEYKGNNTAYFFDEVPVGANVYKEKIEGLIGSEEAFRLLTNPLYFNEHYKTRVGKQTLTDWQSRRMLLFEMCGEMSDEEIIKANPKLAKLPEVLGGKSIDDRKAIIAQSIKKLNEQIETIGPKIDENTRFIPDEDIDYSNAENELAGLKIQLTSIEKKLADAGKVVNEYTRKQQELYNLKSKLDEAKARVAEKALEGRRKLIKEKAEQEDAKMLLESNIERLKTSIEQNQEDLKTNARTREKLLAEWRELNETKAAQMALQFVEPDENSFVCPTCGQELPEVDREVKLAEMKQRFEEEKQRALNWVAEQIETNKVKGLYIKENTEATQKAVDDAMAEINQKQQSIAKIIDRVSELDEALSAPEAKVDYSKDVEYSELAEKIRKLQIELEKPIEDTAAKAREQKTAITEKIEACNKVLNDRDNVEKAKARIEELKQSERDLSNQKSLLEGQLNLINEFIKVKANTLTDIMNSKFKHVRFRLFDLQQNGSVVECCDTMICTNGRWVPWASGNTAGRINAGIDIINALSEHYGVSVPLWVDNAESVTELVPTKGQVIRLYKPEITEENSYFYSKLVVVEREAD